MADKLPRRIRLKLEERLEIFCSDKFHYILQNHSVDPPYTNGRSINITGDYRAIFYEDGDSIVFIAIGTHAQLYQ